MNAWQKLLYCLIKEETIFEEKKLRNDVTYCLCAHSLKGFNPNEIDQSKLHVKCYDTNRYYIGVTTKRGTEMTVPLDKRHFKDERILKLGESAVS